VSCARMTWDHVGRGGGLVADAGIDAVDGRVRLRIAGTCFTAILMGGLGGIVGGRVGL
jgi:hypothetical protein